MTASAYHLYRDLYERRNSLKSGKINPEDFTLRDDLIASRSGGGKFPDIILRTNYGNALFPGGEFIEIKDSQSYSIPSFNSTVPSAYKNSREYIAENGIHAKQMREVGEHDPYHLENREVYYLLRGKNQQKYKVCLVHGSFFETISVSQNIKSALRKSMREAMDAGGANAKIAEGAMQEVLGFNWQQKHLARIRKQEGASVSIRMRVMAETIREANILDPKQYERVKDDTLNMVVPAHPDSQYAQKEQQAVMKMESAFGVDNGGLPSDFLVLRLQHLCNGGFVLFQVPL